MQAVDSRIAGKDPATATKIYSQEDHATGVYVRNTNCWAADIDLTSCSPWNNDWPPVSAGRKKAGTLISPRHVLFVNHLFYPPASDYWVHTNTLLRFVDASNVVYTATVESVHHIDLDRADLTVAALTQDVPTNRFSSVKVLPGNFTNYFGHLDIHVPGLCLDQWERALIHELYSMTPPVDGGHGVDCVFRLPSYGARTNFYDSSLAPGTNRPGVRSGDSGNPAFLLIDDQPVLATLWVYDGGGSGSAVVNFTTEINTVMSQTSGYTLEEFDLSGYQEIPANLR